ncbi:MAG: V-type ATP synthase subunit E [Desulfatirhabdiaceae bacterium]
MPIWGQVELLCRSIAEHGRKQAEALLTQARLEADKIIRDARQQADRQYEEARLSGKSQAVAKAGQQVDTADLEARRRVMTFRRQILQEMIDALKDRLNLFRSEPDYGDFLISSAREGITQLSGHHFIVELNKPDAEAIGNRLEEMAPANAVTIDLRHDDTLEGGLRIFTADGKTMVDNRFSARLDRMEDDIRQEIWRSIGGTQIRPEQP